MERGKGSCPASITGNSHRVLGSRTVPPLGSGEADRVGTVPPHTDTPSSTVPSPRDAQHTRVTPPPSTPRPPTRDRHGRRREEVVQGQDPSLVRFCGRDGASRALDRSRAASSPASLFPRFSRSRRPSRGRASRRSRRGDRRDPAPPSRVKRARRTHAARPRPLAQVASAAIGAAYLIAKKKDDEDGE